MNRDLMPIFGWVGLLLAIFFVSAFFGFGLSQDSLKKDCDQDGMVKASGTLFKCERMKQPSAGAERK